MTVAPFILLAVLLCCSAILSGSETALFSLSRHQLYQCRHSSHRLRKLVAGLMHRPRRVLLTILIGNTTVNILLFASSVVFSDRLSETSPLLASVYGVLTVVLVIVVGEVLAKSFAISTAYSIAPWVASVIQVLQIALTPVRVVLDVVLVGPLTRLILGGPEEHAKELTIEELSTLVEISDRQGIIASEENDMLQEVVALSNTRLRSFMIPRVDMAVFDIDHPREQLLELYRSTRLNKIPACQEHSDKIIGVIHAKDVYLNPDADLQRLIRRVNFVPEQMTADKLLTHFRDTHTQLAIVVDEYGGVAGLVSLEDVVEQIVGDIIAPEEEIERVQQIGPRSYRLAGNLNIQAWSEAFSISGVDSRVVTVGGLIAARLGRVPRQNDHIDIGNIRLTVEHMSGKRVGRVLIELTGDQPA